VPTDFDDTTPTCTGLLLPADAPAPPPFEFQGQMVTPVFDAGRGQWGFWFNGKWFPLYESGC
jgi:hypothetical protein